jgi:hypothetical protein
MEQKPADVARPGKYEFAIPKVLLEQFREEARFVLPETRAGVWVFPPEWIAKLDPKVSKALEGFTVVAVPNGMLGR